MIRICFVNSAGEETSLEAVAGETLMSLAVRHGLPGIIGECGGNCACATCHVYIAEDWQARLPPPDATEQVMLEGALERRPDSRLSCRISTSPALDGMQVSLPSSQV